MSYQTFKFYRSLMGDIRGVSVADFVRFVKSFKGIRDE